MGSYDFGKDSICRWIYDHFIDDPTFVLDVGACDGKWRRLLRRPPYIMDAVEIYEPYAKRLEGYRNVFAMDICELQYDWYDLIIFGDVIEHMSVEKAQYALEYAKPRCFDMIVAVPFLYEQGPVDGNEWQRHIQDDLTSELFDERYPGFEPLYIDLRYQYCYYHLANRHIYS